jgi:uncharacterized ion transporter superfamily protein YfcC
VTLRFPHPLTLMVGCTLLAAALTWVLPAGEFQRRDDPVTGRSVVVAGTYQSVEPAPVGPFGALVAVPKGLTDAADVVFFVFLVGGAFGVVEQTGALRRVVDWLVRRLARREILVVPVAGLAFALGGILMQTQEELIAFVPVLLLLTRRLGFTPLTAVAMSLGTAAVGAAFSPINPFQVGIAQKVAELPLASGSAFRLAVLVPALALWLGYTMRYALRSRVAPEAATLEKGTALDWRQAAVLLLVLGTFVLFVVGVRRFEWDFSQMAALFFAMGIAAGLAGRLGVAGTADAFVEGFRSMALAALLIGFARAIFVVLEEGRIVDTVVHALFTPLSHLPVALSALGMMAVHTVVHLPVPSTSGQAVLTLPVLVPVADLLGLSRQVAVLAYQYGAGLCELVTPTNGALMAMLAAAGVRYDGWFGFVLPVYALLAALGAAAIIAAIALGV